MTFAIGAGTGVRRIDKTIFDIGAGVRCINKASCYHGCSGLVVDTVDSHHIYKTPGVLVNFPNQGTTWIRAETLAAASAAETDEIRKRDDDWRAKARRMRRY